jgi:hypothetical protein
MVSEKKIYIFSFFFSRKLKGEFLPTFFFLSDTNNLSQNGTDNIDLDLLAKESAIISAKAASIDHICSI